MDKFESEIDLIDEIYKFQPESAVWAVPVYDEAHKSTSVKDFQFRYCNAAAVSISEIPADRLIGKCILSDIVPDTINSQMVFQQCLEAFETGIPVIHSYISSAGKYLIVCRTKLRGGVLITARNRTDEYQNKINYQDQSVLLANLIAHSPYGICLYDSIRNQDDEIVDFRLKIKNQKAADITGFDVQSSYTKTLKEMISERGGTDFFDVAKNVVETGTPRFLEYYSQTRTQWMGFSFVKFSDGYLLNFIDISETKKYEEEAKANAKELNTIFNGSLNGIYSAKVIRNHGGEIVDLKFVRANETFFKMFPNTKDKLSGNLLSSLATPEVHLEMLKATNKTLEMETAAIHTIYDKNSNQWFELSMIKLESDVMLVTINDISDQKKAAMEIERAQALLFKSNEDLKRANNNLEKFVFAASHDLQEPLRKIRVFSERLSADLGSNLDNKGRGLIDKIQDACRRMMMLIKDLLELSFVNQGLTDLAEVNLNVTVLSALKDLELMTEEVNPEINLETLPVIKGNARQLQQMFYNIIGNALKFRRPNERLMISISASPVLEPDEEFRSAHTKDTLYWHICIEDNGIGFDNAQAKLIFNVFSRLHTKSEYGGTGIGLSIVEKVVENHNGFIKAEGRVGSGATFHIYLPGN